MNAEDLAREQAIDEIAREYHSRCEAYDRTVCTGGVWRDGSIMPGTSRELALIGKHARQVFDELAMRAPCSRQELHQAIQRTSPG